jgi:predicted F0F1-ATPase subunit
MAEEKSPDASQDSQPEPSEVEKITRRGRMFSARDLRATTIGWEIAIPIVGGPLLGFFLDRQYDTSPRWTLILLGVGILSAVAAVIRYVKYEFYVMNKEENEKKAAELEKMKELIKEQERRRRQRYGK